VHEAAEKTRRERARGHNRYTPSSVRTHTPAAGARQRPVRCRFGPVTDTWLGQMPNADRDGAESRKRIVVNAQSEASAMLKATLSNLVVTNLTFAAP
jgi:hypothetical protein